MGPGQKKYLVYKTKKSFCSGNQGLPPPPGHVSCHSDSFQPGHPDSKGTGCIAERRAALHGTRLLRTGLGTVITAKR